MLDPTSPQAVNLVALTLQSKLGDYSDSDHRHGYSRPYFKFLFENENAIVSHVPTVCVDWCYPIWSP